MNPPKIFISATSGDLSSARQIAKEALLTINCHPVEQTNFEPDWRSVTDMLRGKISDCQALIHLVGFRYGAEPDPATLPGGTPRRSYTQMEYHLARELGLRVYTFLLPETYPFDVPAKADTPEQTQLQAAHRALIQSSPHLYEKPANDLDLRTRIIALQEQVISLEQEQQSIAKEVKTTRHWGLWAAASVLLILGGIGVWQWQTKKVATTIVAGQSELAAQMTQVQAALSRIQQKTDPKQEPISQWPQERLEKELAQQMNIKVEALRALLTAGKTSIDALVAGQALLASGKQDEAGKKFDQVLQQDQAAAQRMKQAWEGKAQISYDKANFEEVLVCLQNAAGLIDKNTAPIAWAAANGKVTVILLELANFQQAEPLAREVLRVREKNLDPIHADIANSLNNLASLLQLTNRFSEAEPLIQRALKIDESKFGLNSSEVATDLNNLANLYMTTNRLKEAEPLMRRALAISEANPKSEVADVSLHLTNLASLLHATNRLTEAESLFRRALKIDQARFGPDHPKVAVHLNNLAALLWEVKNYPEAEALMQRTLSIQEASFGSNHPLVATSLGNLAELLRATNRVKEAEPLARRALKISETSLGPSHPTVATRLNNLGLVLSAGKNFREAEMLHQRALRIDEASLGQNHPDVGRDLGNLAGLYSALGRLDEAEPLLRRNLEIFVAFERETGHHHPHFRIAVGAYYGLLVDLKIPNEQITARLRDVLGPKLASTILGPFQVTITEVVKGGQAESLGLRTGDLFVSYDGQAITSMEQLIHLTDESKGEAIPLEVLRDGKRLTFSAKPGKLAAIIENRPVLPAAGAEAAK